MASAAEELVGRPLPAAADSVRSVAVGPFTKEDLQQKTTDEIRKLTSNLGLAQRCGGAKKTKAELVDAILQSQAVVVKAFTKRQLQMKSLRDVRALAGSGAPQSRSKKAAIEAVLRSQESRKAETQESRKAGFSFAA
jgi:hypothetical protein